MSCQQTIIKKSSYTNCLKADNHFIVGFVCFLFQKIGIMHIGNQTKTSQVTYIYSQCKAKFTKELNKYAFSFDILMRFRSGKYVYNLNQFLD